MVVKLGFCAGQLYAVVGNQYDDRIGRLAGILNGLHHFPDGVVGALDRIIVGSHFDHHAVGLRSIN